MRMQVYPLESAAALKWSGLQTRAPCWSIPQRGSPVLRSAFVNTAYGCYFSVCLSFQVNQWDSCGVWKLTILGTWNNFRYFGAMEGLR